MARTLHSLTYSFPQYDPIENGGPRLNVFFSKLSRFNHEEDNIMIPGIEAENQYSQINPFDELVKKFKKQLSEEIFSNIYHVESLEMIEFKIDQILPKDHFYAFKIFPGNPEKMVKEKSEIQRLIADAHAHGRWYIENFKDSNNTPTGFDSD